MQSETLITYRFWTNRKKFVATGKYFLKVLSFHMIKIKFVKITLVYFGSISNNLKHLV